MNFQGRLTDVNGNPMAAGTYNMKFRIYDAASAGTLLWSEQRANSASTGVTVTTGGLFSVQLGDATSLPVSIFNNANKIYFEIELPTPATATCTGASCESYTEGAMTPRNPLGSSAYAFNSDTLDGLDSTAFAQTGSSTTFTGTLGVSANSTSAFTVGNGSSLFTVDTTNSLVKIGAADSTSQVLVMDTNTADPGAGATSTNGAMYYNSTTNKFRCYQAGAWTDCIGSGSGSTTLQLAYDNSTSPATITTTAAKGVKIAAGAAPTSSLFTVTNAGQATATDNVNGIDVNYTGGAGAIEAAGMRVDYTPGTTSGSSWSGVRIVANATGAASGVTSYGLKLEGPSTPGSGSEVGVQVGGGFDIGIDIASGAMQMTDLSNEPASPATGDLRVYAKDIAGRMMLKMKGPSGIDTALQPALFTNNTAMLLPSTGTTITPWGMPNTTVGTASTPAIVSNGGLAGSIRRVRVTSATTANAAAELRSAQPLVWRGNAAGLGGFFYAVRFSINSTTANQRLFTGLTATTGATATTVAPSAIVNMVGAGWDSADTNLQMMYNAASGTATKIDLGTAFPANNVTAVYEVIMFAPPNGSTIGYRVTRLDTGDTTSGTMSGASLPVNTAMLTHHQYMNNGGTAAAVVLDVTRVYIESDY